MYALGSKFGGAKKYEETENILLQAYKDVLEVQATSVKHHRASRWYRKILFYEFLYGLQAHERDGADAGQTLRRVGDAAAHHRTLSL